jgi:ankyrin repeat protein
MAQRLGTSNTEKTVEQPGLTRKKLPTEPTEKRIFDPGGQKMINNFFVDVAATGQIRMVRRILGLGADVNARDRDDNRTALMHAAFNGHADVCALLINKGADVNAKSNAFGWTALMHAASRNRNAEICELLLKNGADLEAENSTGMTALEFSKSNSEGKTFGYLLFATLAPGLFKNKKASGLFYLSFTECIH